MTTFDRDNNDPNEGVPRRTIVKGAAWSVPIIAVAVAAPTASASTTRELIWGQPTYAVAACQTFTSRVGLFDGGQPVAGETIMVTLPVGYEWADTGSREARPFVTQANGYAPVPGIRAVGASRTRTMTATSGNLSATTSVTTTGSPSRISMVTSNGSVPLTLPNLPNDVAVDSIQTTVNSNGQRLAFARGTDGRLYTWNGGDTWNALSGTATMFSVSEQGNAAVYVRGDGRIAIVSGNGNTNWLGGPESQQLPNGETVAQIETTVYGDSRIVYARSTAGNLWVYSAADGQQTWKLVDSNVRDFSISKSDSGRVVYAKSGGVTRLADSVGRAYRLDGSALTAGSDWALPGGRITSNIQTSYSTSGTGTNRTVFALASDGTLWGWNSTTTTWNLIDRGVTSFNVSEDTQGWATYVKGSGEQAYWGYSDGTSSTAGGGALPDGAHIVDVSTTTTSGGVRHLYALADNGLLYAFRSGGSWVRVPPGAEEVSAYDITLADSGQAIVAYSAC